MAQVDALLPKSLIHLFSGALSHRIPLSIRHEQFNSAENTHNLGPHSRCVERRVRDITKPEAMTSPLNVSTTRFHVHNIYTAVIFRHIR